MYHREWYTIRMPEDAPWWGEESHTCPRCLGGVPNEEMRGQYPGAQSRTDNLTEVCSNCGTMEAIEQMGGVLRHQGEWPLAGGPTRSLQDILNDPEDLGYVGPDEWEQFPHATNITETMDVINRSSDDPDWQRWLRTGRNRPEHGGPHTPDMVDWEGRAFRPNYDEPDPFDTSNPEEAAQAENIEETEQLFSQWDEERDRRRRWLDGRGRES